MRCCRPPARQPSIRPTRAPCRPSPPIRRHSSPSLRQSARPAAVGAPLARTGWLCLDGCPVWYPHGDPTTRSRSNGPRPRLHCPRTCIKPSDAAYLTVSGAPGNCYVVQLFLRWRSGGSRRTCKSPILHFRMRPMRKSSSVSVARKLREDGHAATCCRPSRLLLPSSRLWSAEVRQASLRRVASERGSDRSSRPVG